MSYWNGGLGSGVLKTALGRTAQGVGNFGTAIGIDPKNQVAQIGRNILDPNKSYTGNQNPVNQPATPRNAGQSTVTETPPNGVTDYGSYGGGSGAGEAYDLAHLDTQESMLRSMLGRSQTTLNQGMANLSDSFNRETSSANQKRSRALEDFGMQREDTTRAKTDALGKVDTNARTLNDSLRRMIGMASGSGSSAYQYAAPNAVARQASGERNDVLSNYGENERNLALAERRTAEDFAQLLEDLGRQRGERERELRAGVIESEQGIQQKLADVAGQRSALRGGGYGAIRAAQQPFEGEINSRQAQLDSLFERFRSPMLTPREVKVETPQLRDYLVDRAGINADAASTGADQYSPYSYFLKRDLEQA